ncbi:hypothetical protein [Anabaena sp. PCC 7108]|uniref:hypothetical protein n=1 Tax=Anabaena sp. PCC 7108 TaxID=163908 RepID=UPI00034B8483|nr:hypothetical protein [Anabaena sp. PCC 7108]
MKTLKLLNLVPAILAISLVFNPVSFAQTPTIVIDKNLQSDPTIVNGTSGGSVKSNCGNISAAPSQVIQVKKPLPYLRLTVESQGKSTLLIEGPGGRFCVMADNYSGDKPELSGFWPIGQYLIYIGNLSPQQYPYTLSISQQNK